MEPFDLDMFPSRARLLPLDAGKDSDAGPTESTGAPGSLLPCRVRETGRSVKTEQGESRPVTTLDVALPADPGATLDSTLEVVSPVPMSLRSLGPARARDAHGILWVLPCELVE